MTHEVTPNGEQVPFFCPHCISRVPFNETRCPKCNRELDSSTVVRGLFQAVFSNIGPKQSIAIAKLKAIGGTEVIEGFIDLFCRQACNKDGVLAAEAICELGTPSAVKPLIACFKKLGAFGSSIHDVALTDITKEILQKLFEKYGSQMIGALIEMLDDSDIRIQWLAADLLEKCGEEAIAPLTQALDSEGENTRAGAIMVFGRLKPLTSTVEDRLNQMVYSSDETGNVRLRAAAILGDLDAPKLVDVYASIAKTDNSIWNRWEARGKLRRLCSKLGIECPHTKVWWQFWR